MDGILMIADKLESIEKRIDKQDAILEKISDVIVQTAVVMERQISTSDKIDNLNKRLDRTDLKVSRNHEQILKWSGALVGISTLAAAIVTVLKLT